MNKFFILTLFILSLFSCKKAENIGQNLLPDDDFLSFNYSDTFVLASKTIEDEPLRTDKLTSLYLGSLNDATFGKNSAKIQFEFSTPIVLPADTLAPFIIDSAILFLKYVTIYGDTINGNDIVVKKLNANIEENQIYLSNQTSIFGTTEVGRINNLALQPNQKIKTFLTDTVGSPSVIRIPMNLSYAQEFVDKIGSPDSVLSVFSYFDAYFRGLELCFENSDANTMVLINLNNLASKFSIFYRDKNNVSRELLIPARLFTASSTLQAATINTFSNIKSTTLQNATTSTNTTDSINYIIGQTGTLNKITLPSLVILQNAAINRAELLVTQYESNIDTFQNPITLYLVYKNDNNEWQSAAIGDRDSVFFDSSGQKLARYTFNITKMLNDKLLNRISTNEVYVSNHFAAITQNASLNSFSSLGGYPPTRIVVGGSNISNPNLKTKLRLYYSKK
jgi:hypothetical protein